jgi:hypothetical protein
MYPQMKSFFLIGMTTIVVAILVSDFIPKKMIKLVKTLICIVITMVLACDGNKTVTSKDVIVTKFPETKELKATVMQTAPVILAPAGIFIMNDQIWIVQTKKDTIFDVFNLHDCKYLYSVGTKGQGPDDFIFPQAQSIQVENNSFTVHDRYVLKTVEMQSPKQLRVVKREKIFDIYPVNGFTKLNDSLFCMFAECMTGKEGDFEFEFLLKNTRSKEEIKFSKYPDLTTQKFRGDDKCRIYVKSSVANSSKGKLATFYNYFKFFRIYSFDGTPEKEVHVNIEPYSTDNIDDWEKRNVYYGKPVATERYIYAVCAPNEIQVWDWDGNPVIRYFLDGGAYCFTVSEELKKLYTILDSEFEKGNDELIDKIYVYDLVHL